MFEGQQYESYVVTDCTKKEVLSIKQEEVELLENDLYGCQFCPSLVFSNYNQLQLHLEEHLGAKIAIKKESGKDIKDIDEEFICDEDISETEHNNESPHRDPDYCVTDEFSESDWPNESDSKSSEGLALKDSGKKSRSLAKSICSLKRNTSDRESDDEDLLCRICNKKFTRKQSVRIHLRIHTGERPFKCEECGASFKQNGDLKMHLTTHLGLKPYICEVCNVPFRRRGDVNRHMQVHTGLRPFKCKACDRDFVRASHLKLHWENKHEELPPKKEKDSVKPVVPRERVHCSVCTKSFKSKRNLKEHQKIHAGDKPYKCDVCGKAFLHSGSFNIHTRIHTGERPYPCKICKKTFICSSALGKHMQKSHADSE